MALYIMRGRFVSLVTVQFFMQILLFRRQLYEWLDSNKKASELLQNLEIQILDNIHHQS